MVYLTVLVNDDELATLAVCHDVQRRGGVLAERSHVAGHALRSAISLVCEFLDGEAPSSHEELADDFRLIGTTVDLQRGEDVLLEFGDFGSGGVGEEFTDVVDDDFAGHGLSLLGWRFCVEPTGGMPTRDAVDAIASSLLTHDTYIITNASWDVNKNIAGNEKIFSCDRGLLDLLACPGRECRRVCSSG